MINSLDCSINDIEFERNLFGLEENQVVKVLGILDDVDNGTLYLKKIHSISKVMQGKILRILEEKKFYRLGALNPKPLNIRVIASSDSNFKKKDIIRNDLLKKLNFTIIEIPQITERKDDLEQLVSIFASKIFKEKGIDKMFFSKDAISYLINTECFINMSQLKSFVEWIIIMLNNNKIKDISKKHLIELGGKLINSKDSFSENTMNLKIKDAREVFEKKYLIYNLKKFKYNISKISNEIGMERTALYRKLKTLNIKMEV